MGKNEMLTKKMHYEGAEDKGIPKGVYDMHVQTIREKEEFMIFYKSKWRTLDAQKVRPLFNGEKKKLRDKYILHKGDEVGTG